jgi:hypothetical protein
MSKEREQHVQAFVSLKRACLHNCRYYRLFSYLAVLEPSHHINLCIFPGSCGHSYPLFRNIAPVIADISKNQKVSSHSR